METTGVICRVEEHLCWVSYEVNHKTWESKVTKLNFFSFGIQCNGLLTNIIDVGQAVNVSYRFGPDRRPLVIAVYLGDKPDALVALKAVYDQKGVVVESGSVGFIVESNDVKVITHRDVVFMNGHPLAKTDTINTGDVLWFDAVPCKIGYPSEASFEATCAWIGDSKPRILDRFKLKDEETGAVSELKDVLGTVEVIPNDVVALVSVASEITDGKVILFRTSLDKGTGSLKEVIEVGDQLNMHLRFSLLNVWCAVRACKVSCVSVKGETPEYPFSNNSEQVPNLVAEVIVKKETIELKNTVTEEVKLKVKEELEGLEDEKMETAEFYEGVETAEMECSEITSNNSRPPNLRVTSKYKCVPFKKSWPSNDSSVLCYWPGTVTVKQCDNSEKVLIGHIFGCSSVETKGSSVYVFPKKNHLGVREEVIVFEAVSKNNSNFKVQRFWHPKSDPPCKALLKSDLQCDTSTCLKRNQVYIGKIESVPYADCAIATVNKVPVLVQPSCLVTDEDINSKCCTMNMFLDVGVRVMITVQKKPLSGGLKYFAGEKCWKAVITRKASSDDKTGLGVTWFTSWGAGKFFQKGILVKRDDRFFVLASTSENPRQLEIPRNNFFINSTLAFPFQIEHHVGRIVSYHVKSDASVPCAWTGPHTSPIAQLKLRLFVEKGLVDPQKCYEAVVKDFPLPSHAICNNWPGASFITFDPMPSRP